MSADVEPPRYVLSLQYHFPDRGGARWPDVRVGAMKFEFPSLGDDTWVRRAYWQLLLPPEEHLVVSPRELTGEFAWGWNHFYFGRQPVLSQADLENWVGLRHPGSTPAPAGMNVYLFSSLGRIGPCEIVTAGRSTIVFVSSGIALLAGLLLIYVRAARHPVVLLAATAILAGLTAIYPELALMAAQASAVGLALVLLAVFLRQLTAGSRQPLLAEVSSAVAPIVPTPQPSEAAVPRRCRERFVPTRRSFPCPRTPRHERFTACPRCGECETRIAARRALATAWHERVSGSSRRHPTSSRGSLHAPTVRVLASCSCSWPWARGALRRRRRPRKTRPSRANCVSAGSIFPRGRRSGPRAT